MKRKIAVSIVLLCMFLAILSWGGIGSYSSSSAAQDLRAELARIYGAEYTERYTGSGTEDMLFIVEPKTWFLTNPWLRNALCLDYKYECKVVFTTYMDGAAKSVRTITYQAVDPMGAEKVAARAHLLLNSKAETAEIR